MGVTASAPGKLMLFGEHAVVYGYPCLVTAVDLRYQVSVQPEPQEEVLVETPVLRKYNQPFAAPMQEVLSQPSLPKAVAFVLAAVRQFNAQYPLEGGLKISTEGPEVSYGLGSSSAVTVATVAALAGLFQVNLTQKEIYTMATDAVLEVQGKGSGFDVAAAVYGGTLYFEQAGKVIEPLELAELPVVIGFSGDKVSTTNLIEKVAELKESQPELVEGIFDLIGKLVRQARDLIEKGDWSRLGELMDLNQGLLDALGVSTLQLTKQILQARHSGAYGAKLSGAGGGDCMFALADAGKIPAVSKGIEQAGGLIVPIGLGAEGVRIE